MVGDRRQLVSAVTNLLDNAVKYSEPGSTIEVRARTDGTWVDVTVRDHGIGIPRRDLERIFERFYRVDRPAAARPAAPASGSPSCATWPPTTGARCGSSPAKASVPRSPCDSRRAGPGRHHQEAG